jgi:hypothetical protein
MLIIALTKGRSALKYSVGPFGKISESSTSVMIPLLLFSRLDFLKALSGGAPERSKSSV